MTLTHEQATLLAYLAERKDALRSIIRKLDEAGLGKEPPAINARRYLAKVRHWLKDTRGASAMLAIYGPGIADVIREGEWYLSRLVPVTRLSETQVAA